MLRKIITLSRYAWPRRGCVRGPGIEQYERAFAEAVGAADAIGFWKGRVAFYAALRALGIGEGDEVVLPGYTCMVVSAAISYFGARPVYVDIEPTYCTLDPNKVEAALTPRTRAIMIQHTYGWPSAGLDRVLSLAEKRGIPILEDCCHALGTRVHGRHVGTFGVAGFFSSQWSKPYTTGLGGMLVCRDRALADRVREIREQHAVWPSSASAAQLACQGIVYESLVYPATMAMARNAYRWLSRKSIMTGSTARREYAGWQPDYFKRMCQAQAAAGLVELKRLQWITTRRHELSAWYAGQLARMGWPVPPTPAGSEVALLRFPVRVRNKPEALRLAEKHWIELGDWFVRPLHSHLAPQEAFGYTPGMCPRAERAAAEIVNLPIHPRVSPGHALRAIRFLQSNCQLPDRE